MFKQKTYRSFSILLGLVVAVVVFIYADGLKSTDETILISGADIEDDRGSENHDGRWQYELGMLKDPATGKIPEGMRQREIDYTLNVLLKASTQEDPNLGGLQSEGDEASENNSFRSYGPYNVGGRTRALALDVTDENIILAGGISGGVWRSVNGGESWTKTTSPRDFPPVSSIVQDKRPGHTNDWYFAGGESFGNSASASGAFYFGDGIYRSTDGGLNWNVIAATAQGNNVDLVRFSIVNELAIDLSNTTATEIYVAGPGNIIRTTNDFATTTTVLGQSNDNFNYTDVVVSPTGVVYAAIANSDDNGSNTDEGVFMSSDGISWTNINPPTGLPSTYNRLELALDPNNENTLYLIGGSQAGSSITDFLLRYNRTTGTWTDLSPNMASSTDIGEGHHFQGGYNLYVSVHPGQSNTLFIGGTNLQRSIDGFSSPNERSHIGGYQPDGNPNSFPSYPDHHPDQHTAVYLPSDANVMITGNDGGVFKTNNNLESISESNPVTWQPLNNGYITSQFYAIDMLRNARGDMRIPGGLQDNGSWINYTNDPDGNWTKELGADGAFTAITHNALYLSAQEGQMRKLRPSASGQFDSPVNIQPSSDDADFLFINPFIVDPVHREKLFVAARGKVYFTRDITTNPGVGEWQTITNESLNSETVSALAGSIQPEGVLYFGTRNGSVYRVNDTRTEEVALDITGANMPEDATVSSIAVDPANAERVFVTFSNYNVVSIWMSENGGGSWSSISGNMEETSTGVGDGPSIRWIELLPDGSGDNLYFIATSVGLFMTDQLEGDNTVWVAQSEDLIGRNLTNMIKVRPVDGQVAVATHGNGVFVGNYEVLNSPTINYSIVEPRAEVLIRAPTSIVSGAEFTYQWLRNGEVIADETGAELSATESGTYKLKLTDELNNSVSESNELDFVLDAVAPVITSSQRLNPADRDTELTEVIFRITFSEPVNNVDVGDFTTEGVASGRISEVLAVNQLMYDVTVNGIGGSGRLRLGLLSDTDIADEADNPVELSIQNNQSYTIIDVTAPSVAILRFDPDSETTNSTEVSFEVWFSEEVSGVDLADFELSASSVASASISAIAESEISGVYRVNITGIDEDGMIDLDLVTESGIEDAEGLAFSGEVTVDERFIIENVLITSIDPNREVQIKVLNNPSNGRFTIIPGDVYATGFGMMIQDVHGRQILTKEYPAYQSGTEIQIDLTNQPDGLFLLKISNSRHQDVIKLLKR